MDDHAIRIAEEGEKIDLESRDLGNRTDVAALFGHAPTNEVVDAAQIYLIARLKKEEAEKALRAANEELDSAESLLLGKLDEAGVKSIKVDWDGGVAALSASTTTYYAMPKDGLEDTNLYLWLLRAGGKDLVRRTIHHASFSSFCREVADSGRAVHPAVKRTERRVVRVKRD
jgi:hypothetical protein